MAALELTYSKDVLNPFNEADCPVSGEVSEGADLFHSSVINNIGPGRNVPVCCQAGNQALWVRD